MGQFLTLHAPQPSYNLKLAKENFMKVTTDHEKLAEMIKDIKVTMLTTTDVHGKMHSRPMATMAFENNTQFEGTLWFFTKKDSFKVHEIERDKDIVLTYSHPISQRYVVVYGLGSIEKDKLKMLTLWNPMLKTWFPMGIDDPEIVLIKVEVESAEIWDSPPNTMVKLMGMAKSIVTGHHYEEKKIESREIGSKIH
jgi:general stress protein 26